MTYNDLLMHLWGMTPRQLEETATVHLTETDEFIEIKQMKIVDDNNGVLDDGHTIMTADF